MIEEQQKQIGPGRQGEQPEGIRPPKEGKTRVSKLVQVRKVLSGKVVVLRQRHCHTARLGFYNEPESGQHTSHVMDCLLMQLALDDQRSA